MRSLDERTADGVLRAAIGATLDHLTSSGCGARAAASARPRAQHGRERADASALRPGAPVRGSRGAGLGSAC
ncbi:hypothetical protein WME76_09125 [Sorangium sp. So ce119]|uniref:hypothetical protein n=1 Tax=Sorangium sp. So ce119 TaxID=3133279 RepID=UPI003F60F17D